MKKFNILILAFIIGLAVLAISFLMRHDTDYSMIEVTDYVYPTGIVCEALLPECGYCPGEVTANRCYIMRGKDYPNLDESKYY